MINLKQRETARNSISQPGAKTILLTDFYDLRIP